MEVSYEGGQGPEEAVAQYMDGLLKVYIKAECIHNILIPVAFGQIDGKKIHSTTSCLQMASVCSATVTTDHLTLNNK